MALALSSAGNPVVDAVPAPGLEPAGMVAAKEWQHARPVELTGFNSESGQHAGVRVLWNDAWLFFAFSCSDRSIISPGDRDGLDHFRLGDTAEVFIGPHGAKNYAEIHATPAGRKTLYFCGDYRRPATAPEAAGSVRVDAMRDDCGWKAFFAVPRDLFARDGDASGFDVFFARYDYAAAGSSPELSSFPAQRGDKPDFHRRADYAILRLKP